MFDHVGQLSEQGMMGHKIVPSKNHRVTIFEEGEFKSIAEAHQSPAVTWGVGGACYNVKRELRRNGGARRVYLFNEWNHGTSQETVRRETAPKIPGSVAPATQSRLLEQLGRTPLHRWDNATLLRNPRHPNTGSGS